MLRFLRRSAPPPPAAPVRPPTVGEGVRVYAIGDIHGRLDLFEHLLGRIAADAEARGPSEAFGIVLLGDLIDRGPDAAGVVDLAIRLGEGTPLTCLCGNHEEVFAMALGGDRAALRFFLRIGGRETLASYGVPGALIDGGDEDALLGAMLERVPIAHRDFIADMPDSEIVGDYLFVHAGIRPGVVLDAQQPSDLRWIREDFLRSRVAHPFMVVHGHSITAKVDEQPNRIGIDTGAFASDRLTAIGLEGADRWYLST